MLSGTNIVIFIEENFVTGLVFVAVLVLTLIWTRKPKGIPPGPSFTLPIIGDFRLLFGGDILKTFRKLRQKHGDIFSLYFGKDLVIVINSYELIHEAAVTKGDIFSGRPEILASGGKRGVIFAEGLLWKNQRKFTHGRLQEFGFGKLSFESKILQEVKCFVDILTKQDGRSFDIRKNIHASVANVVFSIVCGKRHAYDDEGFQRWLTDTETAANHLLKVSALLSCAPFLEYVPGDLLKMKVMRNRLESWIKYVRSMYEEHVKTIDENNPRDFFDMFILEMSKGNNPEFTVEQLSMVTRDLFGAGAETTATTIRWALLYLLKYVDIKARLQSDIDNVIPDNQFPSLEDRTKLPFVEAFIMEVLRCANIAPLAFPHAVTRDDVIFHGYRIPRDSQVLFNLDSVLMDPLFKNPTQFNPERFIDADGKVFRPKEFIPFGIGKRICLGEAVAKMELFLFLTTMIKQFDFLLPEGEAEPNLQGVLGVTHAPKPYKVRAIIRKRVQI